MSDNLGMVETEMPDDIQKAVEIDQRIAEGRVSFNRWTISGIWEGDVLNLLVFCQSLVSSNHEPAPAVDSQPAHGRSSEEIEEMESDVKSMSNTIEHLRDSLGESRDVIDTLKKAMRIMLERD